MVKLTSENDVSRFGFIRCPFVDDRAKHDVERIGGECEGYCCCGNKSCGLL